jgi:23S rRNA (uracil1939-C5)-methyltransferase
VARIDQTPFELEILDLSHDGRGVARRPEGTPNAGKTVFVAGALQPFRHLRRLRIAAPR